MRVPVVSEAIDMASIAPIRSIGRRFQFVPLLALLVPLLAVLTRPTTVGADEGWVIKSFRADIAIQPDGALAINETIQVDFGQQRKHGLFRDIPVVYDYDQTNNRLYNLRVR